MAQHGTGGSGLIPVAWLNVGLLLASLVLPPRITAVLAGRALLPGFGLIVDRPGRPGRLTSHRGVLVLLAALIKVSASRT